MIHFGIFTAPALRKEQTLGTAVASLRDSGISAIALHIDNGREGPAGSMQSLIYSLLADSTAGDHLAILQDDMVACPRMLGIILKAVLERPQAVHVMYTPAQNVPDQREANGWVQLTPHRGLWGGQFVMPRDTAMAMVAHPAWLDHLAQDKRHADAIAFEVLGLLGVPTFAHVPSLFDHIGIESTIGNDHSDGQTAGFRFNEWQ